MTNRTPVRLLFALLLLPSACGDDGGGTPRPDAADEPDARDVDAAPPAACAELTAPAGTIDTYPGTFAGTITGGGADLNVAAGVCTVEGDPENPSWYDQVGEDVVVRLGGLTVGTAYVVDLEAAEDLGFYVITGCDEAAGGPIAGMCPVFDDRSSIGETNAFTATTTEAFVVVDNGEFDGPPPSGAFTLGVALAQCVDDTACTDPALPACVDFQCVECADTFDCTAAAEPVCDGATNTCVAGPTSCTDDDAGDTTGGGDDGPAGARVLTPAAGTPDSETGAICNVPGIEADYYRVDAVAGQPLTIDLDWTGTADLDILVIDAAGVAYGATFWGHPEQVELTYLPAGTYYVIVTLFSSSAVTAAVPYTITASTAAPQVCTSATDCAAEYSTQIYRGNCSGGACSFLPPGSGAAGAACDSPDDCGSGLCSYILFEADAQDSVCTISCTGADGCAAVAGTTCFVQAELCVPSCASDLECGANLNSPTVDPGQPWDYLVCTVATGVCSL